MVAIGAAFCSVGIQANLMLSDLRRSFVGDTKPAAGISAGSLCPNSWRFAPLADDKLNGDML
jgi:hypothetical protein